MGKVIYINENIINSGKLIRKGIPKSLPDTFYDRCSTGRFPFTNNPAFPDISENHFLIKILEKEYDRCKNELLNIGDIDSDEDNISNILSQISIKINEIEKNNRDFLEKYCINYIIDLFDIPQDTVDLGVEITDRINKFSTEIQLDPENVDIEYNESNDAIKLKKEILKRRIINMLISGASHYFSNLFTDNFINIPDECSELPKLYKKYTIFNDFLLITNPIIKQSDRDKKLSGEVIVNIGNDVYKSSIESKAENLQVLVYETVKGLMELFASHGLPKDISIANSIIKSTDYAKAEPWNMRVGTILWEKFMKSANYPNSKDIPYIFMEVCKLPVNKFNRLMAEIFTESKKSKRLMKSIISDIEYHDFVDKMQKTNAQKNIIEDEFIHPEEL